MTSTVARSASSLAEAVACVGPVTEARQDVPPSVHCADPSARVSSPRSHRTVLWGGRQVSPVQAAHGGASKRQPTRGSGSAAAAAAQRESPDLVRCAPVMALNHIVLLPGTDTVLAPQKKRGGSWRGSGGCVLLSYQTEANNERCGCPWASRAPAHVHLSATAVAQISAVLQLSW